MTDQLIATWHNRNGILMQVFKRENGTYYVDHMEDRFDITDVKMLRICGLWYDEALKIVKKLED